MTLQQCGATSLTANVVKEGRRSNMAAVSPKGLQQLFLQIQAILTFRHGVFLVVKLAFSILEVFGSED